MFLSKVKERKNNDRDSFGKKIHFLNVAQLLGALNDNIFKFLCVFFLINLKGIEKSTDIMFVVGAIYVLPFLLFSTYGGNLADRFSKQKLIIALKGLEVLVMAFGIIAYSLQSPWGCYALLFLMSFQSALFGPSKYGIIPELVEKESITKANGIITSSTYIAIILGSLIATGITEFTNRNFVLGAVICTAIAIIGFAASFQVPKTVPKRNKRKALFVLTDVYQTFRFCNKIPYVSLSIIGSSFFLFLGAFIQLNIIPYAIEAMGKTEFVGGYLFSPCAIGIAIGSFAAGKTTRKDGNLGLSCLSAIFTSLLFFLLPLFPYSITLTVATLVGIGFSGGLFIVPLDTFIQSNSPPDKRGQVIATTNFLSFAGVLLGPISLAIFSKLNVSPSMGFVVIGVINLGIFIFMGRRLSGIFFNYFSRKLVCPFVQINVNPKVFDLKKANGIVLHMRRTLHLFILMGFSTKIHLYIIREKPSLTDFFLRTFKNMHFIYAQNSFLIAMNIFKYVVETNDRTKELPCLVIPNSIVNKYYGDDEYTRGFNLIRNNCEFVTLHKNDSFKRSLKRMHKLSQISLAFERKKAALKEKETANLFQR
ncbi:MAG: MFS transporter [Rhabdochlamydiaceae bacterium]|nr:MFS transporter [Candidatus Amphrikana amoebophyrae]